MSLADKKCVPCRGGIPPLDLAQANTFLRELQQGWVLTHNGTRLERPYAFKDFVQAMKFANALATVAEDEGHHPDLHISWGKCKVDLWTHKIAGLTESDFVMAAKADRAFAATVESAG